MFTNGFWECKMTNDRVSIKAAETSDEYWLEYTIDEETVSERIQIFFSNENHAHVSLSKKFGQADIHLPNDHTFKINDQVFTKII